MSITLRITTSLLMLSVVARTYGQHNMPPLHLLLLTPAGQEVSVAAVEVAAAVVVAVGKLLITQLPMKGSPGHGHNCFSKKFTQRGVRLNEFRYLTDSRFPIDS